MLAHCLRRWTNIKPTLCERLVFDGKAFLRYTKSLKIDDMFFFS